MSIYRFSTMFFPFLLPAACILFPSWGNLLRLRLKTEPILLGSLLRASLTASEVMPDISLELGSLSLERLPLSNDFSVRLSLMELEWLLLRE